MSSIYKIGKYYYLSVSFHGKRISRSLGATDISVANELKSSFESLTILEVTVLVQSN